MKTKSQKRKVQKKKLLSFAIILLLLTTLIPIVSSVVHEENYYYLDYNNKFDHSKGMLSIAVVDSSFPSSQYKNDPDSVNIDDYIIESWHDLDPSRPYLEDTKVLIKGVPYSGYIYDEWMKTKNDPNPKARVMDRNRKPCALFNALYSIDPNHDSSQGTLYVAITEDGSPITPTFDSSGNPESPYQPNDPSDTYIEGTKISIYAHGKSDYLFDDWNILSGHPNPRVITMDQDRSPHPLFLLNETDDDDNETEDPNPIGDDNETEEPEIKRIPIAKNPNKRPIADPGGPYQVDINNQITLDGSNSYDPDGELIRYEWDLGDGTILYGETVTHTYTTAKGYLITLKVTDNNNVTSLPETTYLLVNQPNRAPYEPNITGPSEGFVSPEGYSYLILSGDPDNDPLQYSIEWGDQKSNQSEYLILPKGEAYSIIHYWDEPGTYTFTVTVEDIHGATNSSTYQISIQEAPIAENIAIVLLAVGALLLLIFLIGKRRKNEE